MLVHVDNAWRLVRRVFQHPPEEAFGGPGISFGAQHEVNRLAGRIDGSVEIVPAIFDLDVGLVDAVRIDRRSQMRPISLLQLRCVTLDSSIDRRVIDAETPLLHHLFQIPIAERIAQIPAHTE